MSNEQMKTTEQEEAAYTLYAALSEATRNTPGFSRLQYESLCRITNAHTFTDEQVVLAHEDAPYEHPMPRTEDDFDRATLSGLLAHCRFAALKPEEVERQRQWARMASE